MRHRLIACMFDVFAHNAMCTIIFASLFVHWQFWILAHTHFAISIPNSKSPCVCLPILFFLWNVLTMIMFECTSSAICVCIVVHIQLCNPLHADGAFQMETAGLVGSVRLDWLVTYASIFHLTQTYGPLFVVISFVKSRTWAKDAGNLWWALGFVSIS